MDYQQFCDSLSQAAPPSAASPYLAALWYDANNNWEKAHSLIQDLPDAKASLIHAYLHRKEGDLFNADYWYRLAGRGRFNGGLEEEWEALVKEELVD